MDDIFLQPKAVKEKLRWHQIVIDNELDEDGTPRLPYMAAFASRIPCDADGRKISESIRDDSHDIRMTFNPSKQTHRNLLAAMEAVIAEAHAAKHGGTIPEEEA